jgi:hypothetical protein
VDEATASLRHPGVRGSPPGLALRANGEPAQRLRMLRRLGLAINQGRTAPSRFAAYQDEDKLTFSTFMPGCGASMSMLLPT